MDYHLAIKKNEVVPFAATWMDLEIITLSELSQKEKDKHYIYAVAYMWNLNYGINGPVDKTEARMYRTDEWLPR